MAFSAPSHAQPKGATGVLVLADGTVVWGKGFGATGSAVGEVCFNTAMTGYEEVMTDPSYAAQIVTFTFPHIGNVGTNLEDIETITPAARGVVLRGDLGRRRSAAAGARRTARGACGAGVTARSSAGSVVVRVQRAVAGCDERQASV